jgi:hypothetical protein
MSNRQIENIGNEGYFSADDTNYGLSTYVSSVLCKQYGQGIVCLIVGKRLDDILVLLSLKSISKKI